jgi:hypothetical protein
MTGTSNSPENDKAGDCAEQSTSDHVTRVVSADKNARHGDKHTENQKTDSCSSIELPNGDGNSESKRRVIAWEGSVRRVRYQKRDVMRQIGPISWKSVTRDLTQPERDKS